MAVLKIFISHFC